MDEAICQQQSNLATFYRNELTQNVLPFWLAHGMDSVHGGILTALDRDGTLLDSDKSIWFQGRGAWTFATMHNDISPQDSWREAAHSAFQFLERHGSSPTGKLYFTVTREGQPLRMRRYFYSESFAAIAASAMSRLVNRVASADHTSEKSSYAAIAIQYFERYLSQFTSPDLETAKVNVETRPTMGLAPWMITIATAQELRANLGDVSIGKPLNEHGAALNCSGWIDLAIAKIERYFLKPDEHALMEIVGADGKIQDHFDGRQLNPGHAIECAWFLLHEGKHRQDQRLIQLGLNVLDWMWERGWDKEYGGLYYFRDLRGLPVHDYWHDMKFWWPHCEAIIATLLAWTLTGKPHYWRWHQQVHEWSFANFADREHGEWYGYLHRDGRISVPLKGNTWKGPFHLPRMLWYCSQLLQPVAPVASTIKE